MSKLLKMAMVGYACVWDTTEEFIAYNPTASYSRNQN